MTKLFTIILFIYLLYYAGNIIYDLFIKKDTPKADTQNAEEFLIGDESQENALTNIEIDDVENLRTPNSFSQKIISSINEPGDIESNEEYWRTKFENEENMDNYSSQNNVSNNTSQNAVSNNSVKWKEILNMAETKVTMVSNLDGYKVYKTTL